MLGAHVGTSMKLLKINQKCVYKNWLNMAREFQTKSVHGMVQYYFIEFCFFNTGLFLETMYNTKAMNINIFFKAIYSKLCTQKFHW